MSHQPVLLDAVLEALQVKPSGVYIDGTFGRGGHSQAILQKLDRDGRLLAMDKDPEAVAFAKAQFAGETRFSIEPESLAKLTSLCERHGVAGRVDGILLDLGVSSPQLDDPERGFSFIQDGPLDMRMDPRRGVSAAEWLNSAPESELAWVLKTYGEERFAKRIARALVAARRKAPIRGTGRLAAIVAAANPAWERDKHPATRSFLAIRIFINRELDEVQDCLSQTPAMLARGGRLVVISFHSLEDRIVKRFIRDQTRGDPHPPAMPVFESQRKTKLRALGKAIRVSKDERLRNPRARSAILRAAERV